MGHKGQCSAEASCPSFSTFEYQRRNFSELESQIRGFSYSKNILGSLGSIGMSGLNDLRFSMQYLKLCCFCYHQDHQQYILSETLQ